MKIFFDEKAGESGGRAEKVKIGSHRYPGNGVGALCAGELLASHFNGMVDFTAISALPRLHEAL